MDELRASFEETFRAEYPGIVRVLAPIVGTREDAEAIAQDGFAKAYHRWDKIGRYDKPGAWIQHVAARDAVRFARRRRNEPHDQPTTPPLVEDIAGALDLDAAIRRLPAKQRASVVLHYLADWPVADVSQAMGCKEATVRVHLHRARAALAIELGAEPHEEVTDGR